MSKEGDCRGFVTGIASKPGDAYKVNFIYLTKMFLKIKITMAEWEVGSHELYKKLQASDLLVSQFASENGK